MEKHRQIIRRQIHTETVLNRGGRDRKTHGRESRIRSKKRTNIIFVKHQRGDFFLDRLKRKQDSGYYPNEQPAKNNIWQSGYLVCNPDIIQKSGCFTLLDSVD